MYYKTCPEITQSFATYPETPTGKTEGSIDKVPELFFDKKLNSLI